MIYNFDNDAAVREGWCLSEAHGSIYGPLQLQKHDEGDTFETDDEAHAFVRARYFQDSPLHVRAMALLMAYNPREFALVMQGV